MVQALKTVLPVREKVKAKEKRYIVLNMDVAAAEQLAAELESGRCKARARLVRALLKEKKLDYTKASRTWDDSICDKAAGGSGCSAGDTG